MFVDKVSDAAPRISRRPALTLTLGLLIFLAGSLETEASPTTPGNFRVTARTAYTVSLAWDPSTNGPGITYRLSGAYNVGPTVILPQTATSYTYTALFPGNTYWFGIYAQDSAGRTSGQADVSTTTLHDTTAPSTAPGVSVTQVESNYAALAWTPAQDDGPYLFYEVWVNGSLYTRTTRNITSLVLRFLQAKGAYSVAIRAYDYGNNFGPLSSPLPITTQPPNPNDHTPPSTPTNLYEEHWGGGDTEIHLNWTQSTDDFDAQANIRYDVYVNGVFQDVLFGSGGQSIVYGDAGQNLIVGQSLIEVIASDTAGNASTPASVTVFF